MTEVYRAGGQLVKVKGMMAFALLCAAGAAYWAWILFNTFGLSPGDGGVLAPIGTRLAWALGVLALGLAFLVGMWIYGRLYVTRIRHDSASGTLHVATLEFLWSRESRIRPADIESSTFHDGRFDSPHGHRVDAPWFTLRVRGRRWPLILDAQGELPDPDLAARLLQVD